MFLKLACIFRGHRESWIPEYHCGPLDDAGNFPVTEIYYCERCFKGLRVDTRQMNIKEDPPPTA
jgi:hypothetical protein